MSSEGGEPELLAARRRKLEALRADGVDPFPHAFEGVTSIADVKAPFADLAPGEETERAPARRRPAGRPPRPGQGGVPGPRRPFGPHPAAWRASTSSARRRFVRLLALDLGDLLGADGTVLRTRRGELSLRPEGFTVLAKSLRPPPEKHHGLADVETAPAPPRARPDGQRADARAVRYAREGRHARCAACSTSAASSRSRRRSCSRSTAARWRGRSPRTTTSSTARCTCGSPPSSTSSA